MDSAQILRQALSAGRFDNLQNDALSQMAGPAVASGQAMGFKLEVMSNPLQNLQDSMEELSFQFEEKTMKSIAERRLGEKHRAGDLMADAIAKWQQLMPDMPNHAFMERMLRNLRQMMAQRQDINQQTLLRLLGEGSGDPSHQFAMLEILEGALKADEKELQQLLSETKRTLESAKGPEIRAGINLAETITAQTTSSVEMQNLRDLYRSEVLGFKNPQECFRSLLATQGATKLETSLDFLVKGCGIDLQSALPSRSPEELHRVLTDLQCVMVLKSVMDRMTVLVGKMSAQFGETCLLNGEKLTGVILTLTEASFVQASDIAELIRACALMKLLAQIYFCTELIGAFRQLSPRLFADEADRFKLEDAAQEHLDELVYRQEKEDQS